MLRHLPELLNQCLSCFLLAAILRNQPFLLFRRLVDKAVRIQSQNHAVACPLFVRLIAGHQILVIEELMPEP